jgi:hypothetical protein
MTATAPQLELPLFAKISRGQLTEQHIEEVCRFLRGRGWTLAMEIVQRFGIEGDEESAKRAVRLIADRSSPRILSSQKGYMLTEEATPQDFRLATVGWKKMRDSLDRRLIEVTKHWHQCGHASAQQVNS